VNAMLVRRGVTKSHSERKMRETKIPGKRKVCILISLSLFFSLKKKTILCDSEIWVY
jgi:hypothetical protein